MSGAALEIRQVGEADIEIVRELFREYAAAIGTDLEYQGFSAELAALPAPYVPPLGALLLARIDGVAAGCVAMRPRGAGTGEMKRLYVRSQFRASRLGQRLVEALLAAAHLAGHRELCLDTLAHMAPAQALYRRLGFVETTPYGAGHLPGTRFFARALRDRAQCEALESVRHETAAAMATTKLESTYIHLGPDGTSVPLPVTDTFWEQLGSGAFAHLGPGRLVAQWSFTEDWVTWEMHPAGEEVVCLLSGSADLVLAGEHGERTIALREAGAFAVVPRGTWHTANVLAPSSMLFITPGDGTQNKAR